MPVENTEVFNVGVGVVQKALIWLRLAPPKPCPPFILLGRILYLCSEHSQIFSRILRSFQLPVGHEEFRVDHGGKSHFSANSSASMSVSLLVSENIISLSCA